MRKIKDTALFVADLLTPTLKESKFLESGELTPEEFVAAGDYLVYCFPSWKWVNAPPKQAVKYLPETKQYLCLNNARCPNRVNYRESTCRNIQVETDLGVWNVPDFVSSRPREEIVSIEEQMLVDEPHEEIDQTAISMEDFFETGKHEDIIAKESYSKNVIMTRTYNLYITYDNYYRVPRLWLMGYSENGNPLTVDETLQDISQDHANKSVALMLHPFLNIQIPSVHPCKHSSMMKNMLEMSAEDGKVVQVHQYLKIFLKFVQTVIPTMEYDYSREIDTI